MRLSASHNWLNLISRPYQRQRFHAQKHAPRLPEAELTLSIFTPLRRRRERSHHAGDLPLRPGRPAARPQLLPPTGFILASYAQQPTQKR